MTDLDFRFQFFRVLRLGSLFLGAILSLNFTVSIASAQAPIVSGPAETALERAFVLDEGKQQARNPEAAAELYRAAAQSGDAFAHLRLGYLTETGDGVPQDYTAARAHYQAAVDAGLNEARLRLAICNLEGWGGPVDRNAFVQEIRTAAEAGHAPAQQIMATLYLLGFGVPENRAEAVKWLERAAAKDNAAAQLELGQLSEKSRRLALMPDEKLARSWFQLSAEQEYRAGMRAMARTFLTGSRTERNWAMGQRWLELATESGDNEAPYILAVFELLHVDSPNHDADRSRAWLQQASDRGNPNATEVLQLEIGGRTLAEAMKYVINVPFEDRYVQRAATTAGDQPTRRPVVYRLVKPIYPQSLRLSQTTGQVLVDFIVDTTGRVKKAKTVKSSHPLFSDRAVEAVQQWRFYPGRVDGRIVNTHMQVPVMFTMDAETLAGVDGILRFAVARANKLGPEVKADASDLRLATWNGQRKKPTMRDGSALPDDVRVLLLLVLDREGRALRGHILQAEPEEIGSVILEDAMAQIYIPRTLDGQAVASNAVLPYVSGRFRNDVLRAPK